MKSGEDEAEARAEHVQSLHMGVNATYKKVCLGYHPFLISAISTQPLKYMLWPDILSAP